MLSGSEGISVKVHIGNAPYPEKTSRLKKKRPGQVADSAQVVEAVAFTAPPLQSNSTQQTTFHQEERALSTDQAESLPRPFDSDTDSDREDIRIPPERLSEPLVVAEEGRSSPERPSDRLVVAGGGALVVGNILLSVALYISDKDPPQSRIIGIAGIAVGVIGLSLLARGICLSSRCWQRCC